MYPGQISISDYDYELPDHRIAMHPPERRDSSKLLVYNQGEINEARFVDVAEYLPPETLMVFNDTKVINARIKFPKESGVIIEIFCLEPAGAVVGYNAVMNMHRGVDWKCLVGGAAKWKDERLIKELMIGKEKVVLTADKIEKLSDSFIIRLSWLPAFFTFAEIAEAAGDIPLPPYIKRNTDETDASRYQTVFARQQGSVAAPTAGLHFTPRIFSKLAEKNIQTDFLTLHVGAGTFKPVKADTMAGHEMHAEYIDVSIAMIERVRNNPGKIAAVGTTSLRTLETLYWLGVKIFVDPEIQNVSLHQWDVYSEKFLHCDLPVEEALDALCTWMTTNKKENLFTQTQLLIAPGYTFRIVNILITNFHQPRSTLLLLVAAAIEEDWKKMYGYALKNDFRFLSYGDANLIFINK